MRWKQFLTPIKSINAVEAAKRIDEKSSDEMIILDVRQPKEYKKSHIPGAMLIPLPELQDRLGELAQNIPILVY